MKLEENIMLQTELPILEQALKTLNQIKTPLIINTKVKNRNGQKRRNK